MLEILWSDFHGAGDFFGRIFTVLETSLEIFNMLEILWSDFHGAGDFFGGIFTVLETSGDFQGAGDF